MADVMCLAYQLPVRNGIKSNFTRETKRLEGSGWKISYVVIEKFQWQPLKFFTLKGKGFHSWISSSVFLNLRTLYVNHSTYSFKTLQLQRKRHHCFKYKDTKIVGLKASVIYLMFNPQNGDLLWQSSTVWVQLDNSFFRYLYFQENIWNQNRWMAHRLDQSTRTTQWFLHFIEHRKPTKNRSCYLGTGGGQFTHKEPGGHYFSSRESNWHNLPPTSQEPQNIPLDKAFTEPLKIFYSQEIEK